MANEIQVKSELKTEVSDVTKTVEEKANKSKPSKKRIILLIIFAIIGIVVLGLTVKFVLDIKWNVLFESIRLGFAHKTGIFWFIMLYLFCFMQVMITGLQIWVRLHALGYRHISFLEYFLLSFVTAFFRTVTPSFLSDSFILVWMKANRIPTYRVTSILFTNTLLWQIIQYTVTFPSFVLVLVYRDAILSSKDGIVCFVLLICGIVIDTFSIVFMYLLCVSRKIHYFLSKVFNWFKKKFRMKYHTKEQIALKYKEKAVIKQDFYSYIKDWKTTAWALLLLIVGELLTYVGVGFSMYFVQYIKDPSYIPSYGTFDGVYKLSFNFGWALNSANVTFTANRLNFFIPNGAGSLEYILRTYLSAYSKFSAEPPVDMKTELGQVLIKNITDNSILVWRFSTTFVPAILGLLALVWWSVRKGTKANKGQKFFVEEKENELNEVVKI